MKDWECHCSKQIANFVETQQIILDCIASLCNLQTMYRKGREGF